MCRKMILGHFVIWWTKRNYHRREKIVILYLYQHLKWTIQFDLRGTQYLLLQNKRVDKWIYSYIDTSIYLPYSAFLNYWNLFTSENHQTFLVLSVYSHHNFNKGLLAIPKYSMTLYSWPWKNRYRLYNGCKQCTMFDEDCTRSAVHT